MRTHLAKFGTELEGGWDSAPPAAARYRTDGSVDVTGRWKVGEIPSPAFDRWATGARFIRDNYPHHVGKSCGLHVHMSFRDNDAAIAVLADSDAYQDWLFQHLTKWGKKRRLRPDHELYLRMSGSNTFCKPHYEPNGVLGGDRYRAVNFCSYHKHQTVEVRVLPAFQKADTAVSAIRRVLSATELYLRRHIKDVAYGLDASLVPEEVVEDAPIVMEKALDIEEPILLDKDLFASYGPAPVEPKPQALVFPVPDNDVLRATRDAHMARILSLMGGR